MEEIKEFGKFLLILIAPAVIGGLFYWATTWFEFSDPFPRIIRGVIIIAVLVWTILYLLNYNF